MSPERTLHIVSGKGGTGKTTIAAALACALATQGRRVLLCEVEQRQGIAGVFDVAPLVGDEERRVIRTPTGGEVFGLSIDAEDALLEYLDTFYHLGIAGKALDRFGAIDFATSIAPGLRDVLLTGKVYEAVRRSATKRANAYDFVVLDAPPTGRIAQFLNIHQAVSGLAKVGPIRNQADSIIRVLRSSTTVVHFVTLLEDMPVTETEEAIEALQPTRIRVGTVIENRVTPTLLDDDQLQECAEGSHPVNIRGLSTRQNAALSAQFALEATRTLTERERHGRLLGLSTPPARIKLVGIDFVPGGVDEGAILGIAAQLVDRFPLEVS